MTRLSDRMGASYTIRRCRPDDRLGLEAMYADFRPRAIAQGLPPRDEAGLTRWLDRVLARGAHLVVEMEGRTVGHAMLIPQEDDPATAELANFLHQGVRGRGIGTALNRAALELAAGEGFRRVWLSVEPWNRAAVRSYRKAGFRVSPATRWSPELEMEAELDGGARPA